ncbi:MAG: glutamine amidotransferase family protein [Pseudomonadota bacterium]
MCGIVGLYAKQAAIADRLGGLLANMLIQMGDRGPDSAGIALYRDGEGRGKLSVRVADQAQRDALQAAAEAALGCSSETLGAHLLLSGEFGSNAVQWIHDTCPEADVMSVGERIEIYKEAVHPSDFVKAHNLESVRGSHALGHTRMATESAVTTLGSHPFSTGQDLCLVHNGSLSNHNRLRSKLERAGLQFKTENDSEVAAGYLANRLAEGDSLHEALAAALVDLDGFYTFAIGTREGFAVLRDPIACKPAVLAETDDWVAMASEYRAIAQLPGAKHARVWEPEPGQIYTWEREAA